jgi:CoA:oxalate CoA-transferase
MIQISATQDSTDRPSQPKLLQGVIVLDLTRVLAGPYATMVLHQLGARVIKVEAPSKGDDSRAFGPFLNGKSTYFTALNGGKESIALDLKSPQDRQVFESLLQHADVLVENFRPGVMKRLGYDWVTLHERYPRLIYAATSGFGATGPYSQRPAYDIVVQAMSGVMSITGQPGGPPTRTGMSIGDITAGLYTAIAINAALYARRAGGEGRLIDIGMLDCQIAILEDALTAYAATGEIPRPQGSQHPSLAPFSPFRAADGDLVIAVGNDALFAKLCEVLQRPDLADHADYRTNDLRYRHVTALRETMEQTLGQRTVSAWLADLEAAGVPSGPINDMAAIVQDPQLRVRNMLLPVHDPRVGDFTVAGNPIKVSGVQDVDHAAPAPDLDADRARLLAEFHKQT